MVSKKMITETPNSWTTKYTKFYQAIQDPECERRIVEIVGKPIGLLAQKLAARPAPNRTHFLLCYFPTGDMVKGYDTNRFRAFWGGLCKRWNVDFMDMTEPFVALRRSYFPVMTFGDDHHYSMYGHQLMSILLIHELKKRGLLTERP